MSNEWAASTHNRTRTHRHFEKSWDQQETKCTMTTTFTKYLMKNTSGTMITWIVQCPCIEICRANNNAKQHGVCNARSGDEEMCTHFRAHLYWEQLKGASGQMCNWPAGQLACFVHREKRHMHEQYPNYVALIPNVIAVYFNYSIRLIMPAIATKAMHILNTKQFLPEQTDWAIFWACRSFVRSMWIG